MSHTRTTNPHTPRDADRKLVTIGDHVLVMGDPDGRAVVEKIKPFQDDPSRFWARLSLLSAREEGWAIVPRPQGQTELWVETTELGKISSRV